MWLYGIFLEVLVNLKVSVFIEIPSAVIIFRFRLKIGNYQVLDDVETIIVLLIIR